VVKLSGNKELKLILREEQIMLLKTGKFTSVHIAPTMTSAFFVKASVTDAADSTGAFGEYVPANK